MWTLEGHWSWATEHREASNLSDSISCYDLSHQIENSDGKLWGGR